MPDLDVLKEFRVVRAGLIASNPSSIYELPLPVDHKVSHSVFHLATLLAPPHLKESNLCMSELPLRVLLKGDNNICIYVLDLLIEIFLHCEKPTCVLMRMSYHVKGHFAWNLCQVVGSRIIQSFINSLIANLLLLPFRSVFLRVKSFQKSL